MTNATAKTVQEMLNNGYPADAIRNTLQSALVDYNRFIEKEEPRSARLRPTDVQETLNFYITKRDEIIEVLATL